MTYAITITQKGQMTLPKSIRDHLGIATPDEVVVTFDAQNRTLKFSSQPTFAELGSFINSKSSQPIKNAVKLRDWTEKNYFRE